MKIIDSSVEIIDDFNASSVLEKIEKCMRICYKSEEKIIPGSAEKIIRNCISREHESPLEHFSITYKVVCDRGVSHEWVRHRIASYSQESTRYCNYADNKFGQELTFIKPWWVYNLIDLDKGILLDSLNEEQLQQYERYKIFVSHCQQTEKDYFKLIGIFTQPQAARAILSNAIKTEFYCTMNLRELRSFFKLRTVSSAHPDIRKLALELLDEMRNKGLSIFFEDIK